MSSCASGVSASCAVGCLFGLGVLAVDGLPAVLQREFCDALLVGLRQVVVAALVLDVGPEASVHDLQFGLLIEGLQHLLGLLLLLLLDSFSSQNQFLLE